MVLTLAVLVAAAPTLPAPASLARFPDASFWPGAGLQREANMLAELRRDCEAEMRAHGPGPQQLAARWARGGLAEADQVALLMGGAFYHHPSLLPAYAQALRSPVLRVRQAAAVGLAWLVGDRPPAPGSIPDTPEVWNRLAAVADALRRETRTRTLVGVWVDSYLAARGLPRRPGWVFSREAQECLAAIGEIADPADLPELLALWPLVGEVGDRYTLLRVLEMVMVARLVATPRGERAGWGPWVYESGAEQVDAFLERMCRSVEGWEVARRNALALARRDDGCGGCTPAPWVALLELAYPPLWAVALEVLPAFGAPFTPYDRSNLTFGPRVRSLERVRGYFEVTARAPGGNLARALESPPDAGSAARPERP